MQQKTHHPVQFEITEQTRTVLEAWMHQACLRSEDFLFTSRLARIRPSIHQAICSDRQSLGDFYWVFFAPPDAINQRVEELHLLVSHPS